MNGIKQDEIDVKRIMINGTVENLCYIGNDKK